MISKITKRYFSSHLPTTPSPHRLVYEARACQGHPVYQMKNIQNVELTHEPTTSFRDRMALRSIKVVRKVFDLVTNYNEKQMTEKQWTDRLIFLECLAGVPGMIGGLFGHLRSLRTMKHDHGKISHLLEEAENERMHLFMFLQLKHPSSGFKALIAVVQVIFFNFYLLAYMFSPKYCHSFVGYLEEEATYTYTVLLK